MEIYIKQKFLKCHLKVTVTAAVEIDEQKTPSNHKWVKSMTEKQEEEQALQWTKNMLLQ